MIKYNCIKSHRRSSAPWDEEETLLWSQILIKLSYNKECDDAHTSLKTSGEAEFLN